MIGKLRRAISRTRMRIRVATFGNNQPWAINRRYKSYHAAAKKRYRPAASGAEAASDQFQRDGFLILPSRLTEAQAKSLNNRVDEFFAEPANLYQVGTGLFRLIDGAERLPDVVEMINGPICQIIEAFYGSYFKIYNVSFYRTVPDESRPESSFLWHFDNCTDEEIKVMIYLDEVTEATGAFRFKNAETSDHARRRGFWHRDDYEAARDLLDDDLTTVVAEGSPGTAVLFRQGRVAHKATAPRIGHRDVVTMVIIPSLIPWREHYARNKHLLSTNAGICLNPWNDQPENIGYRY